MTQFDGKPDTGWIETSAETRGYYVDGKPAPTFTVRDNTTPTFTFKPDDECMFDTSDIQVTRVDAAGLHGTFVFVDEILEPGVYGVVRLGDE